MDIDIIIILLGIFVVVNLILIFVMGKSSKKTPDLKIVEDDKNNFQDEEEVKTVITNNVNRKIESREVVGKEEDDIKLEPIPEIEIDKMEEENDEFATVLEVKEVTEDEDQTVLEEVIKVYGIVEFQDGDEKINFEMRQEEIIIGRDPSKCQLVIYNDKYVGRKHTKLTKKVEGYYIEDLESKNGTFVSGNKIVGEEMLEGEDFRVGRTDFKVTEV